MKIHNHFRQFARLSLIVPGAVCASLASADELSSDFDLSGFYLFGGGGQAEISRDRYFDDNSITALRFGAGKHFGGVSAELGYRGYRDGDDFKADGVDLVGRVPIVRWRDIGLNAGAGAYFYRSSMDSALLNSGGDTNSVSPLLTVGADYYVNEHVQFQLNYEQILDFDYQSPTYQKKVSKNLDQWLLSLVINFPQSKTSRHSIEPAQVEAQVFTAEKKVPVTAPKPAPTIFKIDFTSGEFDYDSVAFNPQMLSQFDNIVEKIGKMDQYQIEIIGGADSYSRYVEHNQALAQKRADQVVNYLDQHGIAKEHMQSTYQLQMLAEEQPHEPKARVVTIKITGK
ncbi:OmpA family protein [Vibrio sp. WXL103]|uniref:OmpA family protein n=1 Tax=unclassified Vibrio TaxID=2614977 RepID=UPI003EC4EAAB